MTSSGPDLQAGGTLDPTQHVYIERAEDAQLLEWLLSGEYTNILSSRQVGKSSLMMQTRLELVERGRKVALVDVAGILGSPASADDWYVGLLGEIVRELAIDVDVPQWWNASRSTTANQRFIAFFRDVVLPTLPGGIVVFLDEIDHTLRLPYTDDFFTAIRAMYNDRAREPLFQRVVFCLAGVATPNELIKDRRTTAYNVGRTLELTDFDPERHDLRPLMRAMSADPEQGDRTVRAVLRWTGGQPYLTARLCEELIARKAASGEEVDRLVDEQYRDLDHLAHDVHFQAITRFLQERLVDGPATLGLYERILLGKREPDTPTLYHAQLKLAGLVKRDGARLVVRNRIYERVFNREWIERSLPKRSAERIRSYAVAAGSALVAVVLLVVGYQVAIVPPRNAARSAVAELMATSDERVALASHRLLSGEASSVWQRWVTRDLRTQGAAAFAAFWERRAGQLEQRALTRLAEGRIAEACMLGAAAALKRDGPLHPAIQKAFNDGGFASLQLTYVPPSEGSRKGAFAQFSVSGQEVLLNPAWGGGAQLAMLEPSNPRPIWRRSFKGEALILANASAAIEFDDRQVRIFNIARGEGEDGSAPAHQIPLPRSLKEMILYLADSSFLRERIAAEASLDWLPSWFQSMGQCLQKSKVSRIRSIGFSGSGRTMAIGGHEFTELCSIDDTQGHAAIAGRIDDIPAELPFSRFVGPFRITADDRLMTTPNGRVYDLTTRRLVASSEGALTATFATNANTFLMVNKTLYASSGVPEYVHQGPGTIVDFTADARYIVAAVDVGPDQRSEKDARLEVVSTRDRKVIATVSGQYTWVSLRADGSHLLTSGVGNDVQLWRTPLAPVPATAPPTPAQRWQNWQTKFGLTLDSNDEPVPLSRAAPHQIAGRTSRQ